MSWRSEAEAGQEALNSPRVLKAFKQVEYARLARDSHPGEVRYEAELVTTERTADLVLIGEIGKLMEREKSLGPVSEVLGLFLLAVEDDISGYPSYGTLRARSERENGDPFIERIRAFFLVDFAVRNLLPETLAAETKGKPDLMANVKELASLPSIISDEDLDAVQPLLARTNLIASLWGNRGIDVAAARSARVASELGINWSKITRASASAAKILQATQAIKRGNYGDCAELIGEVAKMASNPSQIFKCWEAAIVYGRPEHGVRSNLTGE